MDKLFNDCVHGHFVLPPLCVKIIDTHIFQRLRHLKQLGFGYYVYPGAAHNRFEHCLGVCHLAGLIVDVLNKNRISNDDPATEITREEKLCLQIAGLCHDLGHGPFSHSWEHFLKRANDQHGSEEKWTHEDMSLVLFNEILKDKDVKKEFENAFNSGSVDNEKMDFTQLIKDLIIGTNRTNDERVFLFEIISNKETGIDVDKWDYLLRDGKQLNINVTFDPHRLMNCQRIIKAADGKYHICYRDKEKANIWNMWMMRADLHRAAYQHQVVKMIEEMWIDALFQVHREGYTFSGKSLFEVHKDPKEFTNLTDEIFQDILRSKEGKYEAARKLLGRIQERKIYTVWRRETLASENRDGKLKVIQDLTRQIRESQELDLFVSELELKMPDLRRVFLYGKSDFQKAERCDDWSSVPTLQFTFAAGTLKRVDVFFFSKEFKSSLPGEENKIKTAISTILREVEERHI